jgi:hypothetical protein
MTAEQVFRLYRAYKFFYSGDQPNFGALRHPVFAKQRDRQFYYRLAQKAGDAQIHALFMAGFFYHPHAYVADLVTPEAQMAALRFANRTENGTTLLEHELHDLKKRLPADLQGWLYGLDEYGKVLSAVPSCLHYVVTGELAADLACLLLLIPQRHLQYDWPAFWASQPDSGLGSHQLIDRLKKLDQLFNMHRLSWRLTTHTLARQFWTELGVDSLAPILAERQPSLFNTKP